MEVGGLRQRGSRRARKWTVGGRGEEDISRSHLDWIEMKVGNVGLGWQSGEKQKSRKATQRTADTPDRIWALKQMVYRVRRAACMRKRVREFPQVSHRRHVCEEYMYCSEEDSNNNTTQHNMSV
jgi:hypothetical protein